MTPGWVAYCPTTSGDLEQLLSYGVDDGFHPRVQLELLQDVADVVLHGVLADEQLLGDVAVVEVLRDELEDLHLAIRESWRRYLLAVIGPLDHRGELGEQLAGHRRADQRLTAVHGADRARDLLDGDL